MFPIPYPFAAVGHRVLITPLHEMVERDVERARVFVAQVVAAALRSRLSGAGSGLVRNCEHKGGFMSERWRIKLQATHREERLNE